MKQRIYSFFFFFKTIILLIDNFKGWQISNMHDCIMQANLSSQGFWSERKRSCTFSMDSKRIGFSIIGHHDSSVGGLNLEQFGEQGLGEGLWQAKQDVAQVEGKAFAAVGLAEQLGHTGPQLAATCTDEVVIVVAFFSLARILRDCSTIHFPTVFFLFF